ncbi:MAG: hypothetical protein J6M34_06555 [Clostridia bacterium]|nr:hypothetical protein [Clostridia bacterium]
MRNQKIGKNVRDLGLRYLMICVFMFMCVPLFSIKPEIMEPLLGTFYFIVLIYYFWFTMKTEGGLDVNRVRIGQVPRFRWKGAVCALFLVVPMMIICVVPLFFHDPYDAEFRPYFTGEEIALTEEDRFNQLLRDASGKEGYVSSVAFNAERKASKITYETSKGVTVHCVGADVSVNGQEMCYIDVVREDGKTERVDFYVTDGEKGLNKLAPDLQDAFKECLDSAREISGILIDEPLANWQVAWNFVKVIVTVCLTYFCAIFATNNPVVFALVFCLCMLVLAVAAQVGYDMGYNGVEIMGKKKPVKDGKAGDSVVIQRGGSKK